MERKTLTIILGLALGAGGSFIGCRQPTSPDDGDMFPGGMDDMGSRQNGTGGAGMGTGGTGGTGGMNTGGTGGMNTGGTGGMNTGGTGGMGLQQGGGGTGGTDGMRAVPARSR